MQTVTAIYLWAVFFVTKLSKRAVSPRWYSDRLRLFILLCNSTLMLDYGFTAFKQIEPKWYRVIMLRLLEDNADKVLEIQRIPNVFQSEIVAQAFGTI